MEKINFDNNIGVILVDVFIKNNIIAKKVRMALDTEATYSIITKEVAQSLELQPELSNEKIQIITASETQEAPVLPLEKIRIGKSEVENIKVIVHDLPQQSLIDGLLGLNFLKNFNIHLNFKQGFLEFE